MTYQTAIQAIAVSNNTKTETCCEDTPKNFVFLYMEASQRWHDDEGNMFFSCDAPGNEWTVRVTPSPYDTLVK